MRDKTGYGGSGSVLYAACFKCKESKKKKQGMWNTTLEFLSTRFVNTRYLRTKVLWWGATVIRITVETNVGLGSGFWGVRVGLWSGNRW